MSRKLCNVKLIVVQVSPQRSGFIKRTCYWDINVSVQKNIKNNNTIKNHESTCLVFTSFHYFVSICFLSLLPEIADLW